MAPLPQFGPCSSSSNGGLARNLRKAGVIRSAAVFDAMTRTDRAKYLPITGGSCLEDAYQDSPVPIGYNQTISAPHMHAHVLELGYATISDVDKPRVLDIGAGSGYLTASFGRLVDAADGHVFGLELLPQLAQFAKKNVQQADADLLDRGVLSLHCHNGWHGLPTEASFHFIFVGAAVTSAPQVLLDQLADGGQLVVPIDEPRGGQALVSITRRGASFVHQKLMPACFVPLVRGELAQKRRGLGKTQCELNGFETKLLHATHSFRTIRQ